MTTDRKGNPKPLKLGDDASFTIAGSLDYDDELLIEVDAGEFEYDRYITITEMKALRAHLDRLLEGK